MAHAGKKPPGGQRRYAKRVRVVAYLDVTERAALLAIGRRAQVTESQLIRRAVLKTYGITEATLDE